MSWMDGVNDVLQKYRGAPVAAPPQKVSADFDSVAQAAPPETLAGGLAAAFRSPTTPDFPQMIAQLFGQSNGAQQAGILNHLMQSAGAAGLSGGALAGLSQLLPSQGSSVTPQQAQQVSPEAVQKLAQQVQERDPSILDKASEFYAQHPSLVKGLGAVALAAVMSHVSRKN
jgi:hypothetical protein